MLYLASAFALNMLPGNARLSADIIPDASVGPELGHYLAERNIQSVVGHQASADVLAARLGIDVPVNRAAIKMKYGDSVYVLQLGVRLQEGQVLSKEEMLAVPLTFWVVTVMKSGD